MTATRISNQRGSSLVETIVALGLFAISAATTGDFLVQQIRHAAQNNHYSIAYSMAEEHLEAVRAARYVDMVPRSQQVQKGDLTFDISTTVLKDVPAPNLKKIKVQVNWNEPGGSQQVEVETIYTAVRRF